MTDESPQTENESASGQSRAGEAGANLTDVLGAERYQKIRRWHPRLEVRYWTGQWWEPLTGEKLDAALDGLEQAPNATGEARPKWSEAE